MSSKISVIVPVYNTQKYLPECIESIREQSYKNLEIILVDDGSTDQSGHICDEYAKKDPRIIVFHQENKGQAHARNFALTKASGQYVCYVDSDDVIHRDMIKKLYQGVLDYNTDISMPSALEALEVPEDFHSELPSGCRKIKLTEHNLLVLMKADYYYWVVCGKLIRKEIPEKFPFPEGRIFEDNAVVYKWLLAAEKVVLSSATMYFYRSNPGSTSRAGVSLKSLDYIKALEEQISFYEGLGYKKAKRHILKVKMLSELQFYYPLWQKYHDKKLLKKMKKSMYTDYIGSKGAHLLHGQEKKSFLLILCLPAGLYLRLRDLQK